MSATAIDIHSRFGIHKSTDSNDLTDFIRVYENALSDELCDTIVSEYGNSSDWITAGIRSGENTTVRNTSAIGISNQSVIELNQEVRAKIDHDVFLASGEVIRKYHDDFPDCDIQEDSGYDLLRYDVGQFYTRHTDSFKDRPRAVTCSFALNDDYSGGEFLLLGGDAVIKVPKGGALLFPSNFMYPHEILKVTKGTRYSIVTWFV
jgi:predicted 2-oxoglutarate/Fe(II)-dependent dioxygenase YbiX